VELHRHWPDPGARALLFVREVRAIVVSRKHMTLSENAALLHFVDSVVLQQLLPEYENERKAQQNSDANGHGKLEAQGTAGQEPLRDRPLRLSLLLDRIFAFDRGEKITFALDPAVGQVPTLVPQPVISLNSDGGRGGDDGPSGLSKVTGRRKEIRVI